jgi:proline iminopeptidase
MKLYKQTNCKHFYLDVDKTSKGKPITIYIEESGNPDGIPLLSLHGGPGGPMTNGYQKLWNGTKYRIITFHQRGCGLSTPKSSLEKNKTSHLLKDIEKIRKILGIKKWLVEGGSWGATLAVIYSIKYTDNVIGLIIGGLGLMDKQEMEGSNRFSGADIYHKWKLKDTDRETMKYYLKKLQSPDFRVRNKFTKMWNIESELFVKMAFENVSTHKNDTGPKKRKSKKKKKGMNSSDSHALALLECYYYLNRGFIPRNFILDNAHKLNKIPGFIIHGRFDLICSPENSYLLSTKWTNSKLIITDMAGHSFWNTNNVKAWIESNKTFDKLYPKRAQFYEKNVTNSSEFSLGCYKQ